MTPLGPLLSIRPSVLDESSPSDLLQNDSSETRSGLFALEVGQFIDARILALEPGGALAQLGGTLFHLNYPGTLKAGQDVRLQLLERDDQFEFRIADLLEAEGSSVAELSGALPQLVSPSPNQPGATQNAPINWPPQLLTSDLLALPQEQLVQLLETGVRGLLSGRTAGDPSPSDGDITGGLPGRAAGLSELVPSGSNAAAPTPDPRFLAFIGWAWPEQLVEFEVDHRSKHAAVSDYMRSCVVSMRLHLPKSGRVCGLLTSSTAGLVIDLEVEREATATRMREQSGQFLDLLKALDVRVNSMVVRHV
jgi:hypothetical protein